MISQAPAQGGPAGTVFEIPIRLAPSHGMMRPGFQSNRKGEFWHNGAALKTAPFDLTELEVIGVMLKRLSLSYRDADWYSLLLEFAQPRTMNEAEDYVQRLSDAFTVSMAADQHDPWYGNLVLEVGWAGMKDITPKFANTLQIDIGTALTHIGGIQIISSRVQALRWTPLTAIFAEGMRAAKPRTKFLFWFVILEELEGREESRQLFTPLFAQEEKEELLKANLTSGGRERLEQLLNNPLATQEGRPQKLLKLLQQVGLGEVQTSTTPITIDEAICRSLIKQRNTVAHKGTNIDEGQLYTVLFPLARDVLRHLCMQDD